MRLRTYIPTHIHTEYSFLDGLSKISKLVQEAKKRGLKYLAISDHNITGIVEFYTECRKHGIIPIIGTEMYINNNPDVKTNDNRRNSHLVLLVKNLQGYRDLIKIYSEGATKHYYYKPRVSLDIIKQYNSGNIIATSACIGGQVPRLILEGRISEAEAVISRHKETFGDDNYYLEMMPLELEEQKIVNVKLVELSKKTNTPLIITTDAHYINKEDSAIQKILLQVAAIQQDGKKRSMEFSTDMCWMMTYDEIVENMGVYHPDISEDVVHEALANTVKLAEKCEEYKLASDKLQVPNFELPKEYSTHDEMLRDRCMGRIKDVYGDDEKAMRRLEYELGVIAKLGYSSYFLIVEDIIKFARANNIAVGPGRGSAAGCVVSYLLGIVRIDPIKWGLHFERFLNPERAKPPDIDIDFSSIHRHKVIEYIQSKYGREKVAQIITYSKMGIKSALKDVNRVTEDMPYEQINAITKIIPYKVDIKLAVKNYPEVARAQKQYKRLFEIAEYVDSMPKHPGKHPAGVVVTPHPIDEYAAVSKDTDDKKESKKKNHDEEDGIPVLQLDMDAVTKMNLLKIDCLAISGLDLIEGTFKEIENNWGKKIDWDYMDRLNLNDPVVYKMIGQAKTNKIFQLGSPLFKKLSREVKPEKFEDLIAILALGRPGPLGSHMDDKYKENKNDPKNITHIHDVLKGVMDETNGIILYQEQVMEIYSLFSGVPFGEADLFRRHMEDEEETEKYKSQRKEWRDKFISGAIAKGYTPDFAVQAFDWLVSVTGYLFNKSHSASYAINAYHMAWLKAYYFLEFMVCTLRVEKNADKKKSNKKELYVEECYSERFPVLPVDVNKSKITFECEGNNAIRTGFTNIKGVGAAAAEAIIENLRSIPGTSKDAKYKSMTEFFYYNKSSMNIVRRVLEPVMHAGGFDEICSGNRKLASHYINAFLKIEKELKKMYDIESYDNYFGMYFQQEQISADNVRDYSFEQKAKQENEVLDFCYRRGIIPKKRVEPNPDINFILDKKRTHTPCELKTDEKINEEKGEKKMSVQRLDAELVEIKSQDDGHYKIKVKYLDDERTQTFKVNKAKVIKHKELLSKVGNRMIVCIHSQEDNKMKLSFEAMGCVSNTVEEQKPADKICDEQIKSEDKSDDLTKDIGHLLFHSKTIPVGLRMMLFDSLVKGVDSVDELCKQYYVDLYIDNYESFLSYANFLNGKLDMKILDVIQLELCRDERFADFGRPPLVANKSSEELRVLRGKATKILNKRLGELQGASDREGYKKCIKAEKDLDRIERTLASIV